MLSAFLVSIRHRTSIESLFGLFVLHEQSFELVEYRTMWCMAGSLASGRAGLRNLFVRHPWLPREMQLHRRGLTQVTASELTLGCGASGMLCTRQGCSAQPLAGRAEGEPH